MNKTKVKDNILTYKDTKEDISLDITKEKNIFIYAENSNLNINADIKKDFTLNIFSFNSTISTTLDLNSEDISINYFYSTLNIDSNTYNTRINHNKKKTNSEIISHGLNLNKNKLDFLVEAFVPKTSVGCNTNQDSIIISESDNTCLIKPNLLIDTDDVIANHSAYLGKFKEEELFYLKARGLNEKEAKKLLAKSFLIGKMDISFEEKNIILEKLDAYWR